MYIFSFLSFLLFAYISYKYLKGRLEKEYIFFLTGIAFALIVATEVQYIYNKKQESVPTLTFTVKDKTISTYCYSSKINSCSDSYILILETDNNYFFKQEFNVDTYYKFNVGDRISYQPKYELYEELKDK